MPARGQRRTTTGLNRPSEHGDAIRDALERDAWWQVYSRDGRWICPFCLTAVRPPQGQTGKIALLRAIERHLVGRCSGYDHGKGQPQPMEAIQLQAQHEDISSCAMSDPAWQVFDHEGYWYSPSSLRKVPTVRITTGRLDNFVVQQMVRHLGTCQLFQRGDLHDVRAVQAARDQGMRIDKLATDIEKLLGHPIWRYRDSAGCWICPYCLDHVVTVRATGERDWRDLTRRMATHLLTGCSKFGPGQNRIHDELSVRGAAQQAPPPLPTQDDPPTRYARSQSNATPIATPINLPKGVTPPAGTRRMVAGSGSLPQAKPLANPLVTRPQPGHSSTSGRAPAVKPDLAADDELSEVALKPGQSSAHRAAVGTNIPVAQEVDDSTRGQLYSSRASEILAGSFLSQPDAGVQTSQVEGDTSDTFADLIGSGFEGEAGKPQRSGRDNPLAWMDDAAQTEPDQSPSGTPIADDTDLMRARDVQIKMLRKAPELPGYAFASRYESCGAVSGDFYEYIELPDGRIGFAQADVSGHGMQAGLIMSMAKKVLAIFARQHASPVKVLAAVNDALVEDLHGKMFVSMTYAVLDPKARTVTWARAGHAPTIRFNIHTKQVAEINPPGMVVGMKAGPLFEKVVKEEVTRVESGDIFLLYTDGITETMNRQGEEYGTDLLKELLDKHADQDLDRLLDRILDSVRGFRGGQEAQDDMTLLAMLVK